MGGCRTILAVLIGLAVAVAPLGSALVAANATAKQTAVHAADDHAMADCSGHAADDHSCCDPSAGCPDLCGVTCCKLMGIIAVLAAMNTPEFVLPQAADPLKPAAWRLRPRPPPPRT
jgi:hypothetical protein